MKLKIGDIVYGTDSKREDIIVDTRSKRSLKDILLLSTCAVWTAYFTYLLGFTNGAVKGSRATVETSKKVYTANATKKEI